MRLDRRDDTASEPMRGEERRGEETEVTRTTQERMSQGDVKGHIANSQCQKTIQLRVSN